MYYDYILAVWLRKIRCSLRIHLNLELKKMWIYVSFSELEMTYNCNVNPVVKKF